MPFTPEEVERQEFASSLTGYDKTEVRAFLRALAAQLRREADGQPLRVAIDKDLIARTRELIDRSENSLRRLAKAAEESGHLNVVRLKDEAAADRQALTRMAKEAMAGIQDRESRRSATTPQARGDARGPDSEASFRHRAAPRGLDVAAGSNAARPRRGPGAVGRTERRDPAR